MLQPEDYKEPSCPFCKDFYNPAPDKQQGSIPVPVIIQKLDEYLNKEDYKGAKKHLDYWIAEAKMLNDRRGELSLLSEMMGLSRRLNDKISGLDSVRRGFEIIETEGLQNNVSAATIWLNGATTLKAFGHAAEGLAYYERTLELYNKQIEPNDERFGGLYNNYALACADVGQLEKAKELYEKAIIIMSKQKNGALEVAITYLNMAQLYEDTDEEIENLLEKAYEKLNDPQPPRDGYYAFVCRKCAPTFDYYGHFAIKEELNKRADEIYARA